MQIYRLDEGSFTFRSRTLLDENFLFPVRAPRHEWTQYEALKERLERLYRRSMGDLNAHKLTVEGPTLARIEVTWRKKLRVQSCMDYFVDSRMGEAC